MGLTGSLASWQDAKLEQVRRATLTEALAGNATTRDQLISIGTATLKRPGSLAWGSERYDELLSVVVRPWFGNGGSDSSPATPSLTRDHSFVRSCLTRQSEHLELDSRVAELENKLSFVDELNKWCLQEVRTCMHACAHACLHDAGPHLSVDDWDFGCSQRGNAGMERLVVLIVLILSVELVISVTETYEKFFKHPKDRHGADTAMETTGEVVRA